ncbi:MAG: hypothetical protein HY074_03040 [Deltaproteobacteria bacterium]|nr:hypothetical protein [Deltaproteobacteria bacterium]
MIRIIVSLISVFTLGGAVAAADDFAKLEKKQKAAETQNPFANRKVRCVTREGTLEMVENWEFLGTGSYVRKLSAGITLTGTYEVAGKILKINDSNGKKWDYKYKATPKGYQYIHENAGEKSLYTCTWAADKT